MRWSKIKTIIILMLCVVNAALLLLVGTRAWRSQRQERRTRSQMVAVLEKNGVEFLPGEVPGALEGAGTTITGSTALARFLETLNEEGYVCSQITGMYADSRPGAAGTATPVWIIETDAWPWRFTVDGYTGKVTVE